MTMDEPVRILVVDDEPHLLRAGVRLLRSAGYDVLQATTGEDALRLAGESRPALVLLDVVLPGIDGLEVCRRIKADPRLAGTLVVMLSGSRTTSGSQAEGLETGADGYITRPVGNRELLARVQALLRIGRAEQALRESEFRYRALFDNMLNGFAYHEILLDEAGRPVDYRFLQVNTAFERLTGLRREDIVGRTVTEVLPGIREENFDWIGTYGAVALSGRATTFEQYFQPLDRWYSVTAYSPRKGRFAVMFEDVTERKRVAEELERSSRELARSNAELRRFLFVASHHLQEPLRQVVSHSQFLAHRYEGRLDTDADELIGYIVDGVATMRELLDDLLTYTQVEQRERMPEPTCCETLLAQALARLQETIATQGAEVTHDPLPVVLADGARLGQVFHSLIDNGLKFHGSAPPRLHVSAIPIAPSGGWCFSVRDNGIGIEAQYAERIFEIFQRLHTRDAYPGTGIGLALCKKIVERHGGRIWVESIPGEGATFYFTLPG